MIFPRVESRSVLITGCSTGIGLATARLLRERGWRVIPTARKPAHLDQLRAEGFSPIALDMADSGAVGAAADAALQLADGRPGALVNNAGYGQPGALEDLSRAAMRHQFEVNVLGLQDLTNRFIPLFRRQGFGRIVNISSVLGRIPLPLMGIYVASKYAVEGLSDTLRVELRGSGVAVAIVEPGPIATDFGPTAAAYGWKHLTGAQSPFAELYRKMAAGERAPKTRDRFTAPPAAVAEKIRHALESPRPRRRYPVTPVAWAGALLRRLAPDALVDRLVSGRLAG
ncbi:MAG: SDR family NAD(P)-dependent oxidoreductase [Kiritimatiellaeota bacterium]|nr:SDR family NAD(P)-dependent oxidoreductase [Kiritimatiellota bacterium]